MRAIQRNTIGVAIVAIVFAALTLFARPSLVMGRVIERFELIPAETAEWSGYDVDVGDARRLLPNSSILMRDYHNAYGRRANLSIVYGLDIAEIHNPEMCFEGQGWKTVWRKTIMARPPAVSSHRIRLALVNGPDGKHVCAFWYAGPQGAQDTLPRARWDSWKSVLLTGKLRPSALIRILVPVVDDLYAAEQDALSLAYSVDAPVQRMVRRNPIIVRAQK